MKIEGIRPASFSMRLDDLSQGEVFFVDPTTEPGKLWPAPRAEFPFIVGQPIGGTPYTTCVSVLDGAAYGFRPDLPVAWVAAKLVFI